MSISTLGREGSASPVVEGRSLVKSFGRTPALNGASVAVAAGEIARRHGPERLRQVHAAALPGGDLHPRLRRGALRRAAHRPPRRDQTQRDAPEGLRLRVPVRPARARTHRRGQHRPAAAARRTARRHAYAAARAWLPRLGLDGLGPRRTGEVSGGEAQRVALARALVHHPTVLFADEPTGSLDSLTGEHVMELLVSLTRAEGTTVVLVTHEPRVAAYADRMVLVRDGQSHRRRAACASQSHPADTSAARP